MMSEILTEQIIPNLTLFTFENHLLGLDRNTSGVFEIFEEKECIELKGFVNKGYAQNMSFSKVIVHNRKMYFIPYNCNELCVYDVDGGVWNIIKVTEENDSELFLDAMSYKNRLFLFPFNYEQIIVVNTNSLEIEERISLADICPSNLNNKMFIKHLQLDDEVILPIFSANTLLRLSCENYQIKKIDLNIGDFEINSITLGENYIYLLSRNSLKVIKVTMNLEFVQELKLDKDVNPMGNQYTYFDQSGFEYYEGKLFCFPARWNHTVKIITNENRVELVNELDELAFVNDNSETISKYNHGIVLNNKLYIMNFKNQIVVFDLHAEKYKTISVRNNDPNGINFRSFLQSIIG